MSKASVLADGHAKQGLSCELSAIDIPKQQAEQVGHLSSPQAGSPQAGSPQSRNSLHFVWLDFPALHRFTHQKQILQDSGLLLLLCKLIRTKLMEHSSPHS